MTELPPATRRARASTSLLAVVVVVVAVAAGCHRSPAPSDAGAPPSAAASASAIRPADASLAARPSPSASPRTPAAPPPLTRAQRRAYAAALAEGRSRTKEKNYDAAITAFTRALAILPTDARPLSERGYARYLSGDPPQAKADFDLARVACPSSDAKLAAQIEFNLGLVLDKQADAQKDDQLRKLASGHYRRSDDLFHTKAAQLKSIGCPASWGPIGLATYSTLEPAEKAPGAARPSGGRTTPTAPRTRSKASS